MFSVLFNKLFFKGFIVLQSVKLNSFSQNCLLYQLNNNKFVAYSCKEHLLDFKYRFVDILKSTLFFPAKRLIGLIQFLAVMYPEPSRREQYALKKVTIETIDRDQIYAPGSVPPGLIVPSKDRLRHLLQRVDFLAKKMDIQRPFNVYSSSKQIGTGCGGGTYSRRSPYIQFDLKIINLPDDQLDAVIVHEITHAKENHSLKQLVLSATALSVDVMVGIFFPFFTIFGAEFISSMICRSYQRYHEKRCDLAAMRLLGTGRGLSAFFEDIAKKSVELKNTTDFDSFVKKLDPRRVAALQLKKKLTPAYMKKVQERITPDGNNRRDFAHPTLTSRAELGRQFSAGRHFSCSNFHCVALA